LNYKVWMAQDPALGHQIGRADGDGWSVDPNQDSSGWMQYGPYVGNLPVGNNVAIWNLMIDNNIPYQQQTGGIIMIDVNDATTQTRIASQVITRLQFNAAMTYQEFALPFTVDTSNAGHTFEFRIWWYGGAYVKEQFAGFVHPQWNAQDSSLGHVLGRADGDGWSVNVSQDTFGGWMQYGPYTTTVQPGNNVAVWNLMVDNNTNDNNGIVVIDVNDATTQTRITSQIVTRMQFNTPMTYQTFALPFTVDPSLAGHQWEFRVWWIGWSYTKEQCVGFLPVP